uniref:Uncharacterized protein n=1 Tax=Anopheles culicifacies TaxID=139723 RepID=A0A182MJV5_9DIPT
MIDRGVMLTSNTHRIASVEHIANPKNSEQSFTHRDKQAREELVCASGQAFECGNDPVSFLTDYCFSTVAAPAPIGDTVQEQEIAHHSYEATSMLETRSVETAPKRLTARVVRQRDINLDNVDSTKTSTDSINSANSPFTADTHMINSLTWFDTRKYLSPGRICIEAQEMSRIVILLKKDVAKGRQK